jgi:hypothetical protein
MSLTNGCLLIINADAGVVFLLTELIVASLASASWTPGYNFTYLNV